MRNLFEDEFIDGLDDEFLETHGTEITRKTELLRAFMEYDMNREAGKVAPDTTGADKYFIDGFFTGNMNYDFWVIARDFMNHHFRELGKFDEMASYMNGSSYQSSPEEALQIRILSIIYKAAKSGDTYSVSLMKNLYKTYHKREYNQLKRFKTISVPEIFSLSETTGGHVQYETMARILGMCSIYGIEMEDKCSILYILLNNSREEMDNLCDLPYYEFPEGVYQQCLEQVDAWMDEEEKGENTFIDYAEQYWKTDLFVGRCLERYAYPEDFLYRCDKEYYSQKHLLAQTLALLKSVYPKEEFSYEDVQKYAHIYKAITALVSVCDSYDEDLNELFGISTDRHLLDGRACLYKPEPESNVKIVQKEIKSKPVTISPASNGKAEEADYLKEIEELRQRLHKKEEENRGLQMQYNQSKRELKEHKELLKKYENDRTELIALRNHVYHLSEEDVTVTNENFEEMKSYIAEKNIAIVGGHTNWVNKIKRDFPNWKVFDANVSRINEAMILDGTERLYFFTNHLSHNTYGIYIAMVRENKIPFGYLHSVNMEAMVRQIYHDMK